MSLRLRAHLRRHYVEIAVPTPTLRLEAGSRWIVTIEPTCWRWGRWVFPDSWRKLPPVDGIVEPITRHWSYGPLHFTRFRWRHPAAEPLAERQAPGGAPREGYTHG